MHAHVMKQGGGGPCPPPHTIPCAPPRTWNWRVLTSRSKASFHTGLGWFAFVCVNCLILLRTEMMVYGSGVGWGGIGGATQTMIMGGNGGSNTDHYGIWIRCVGWGGGCTHRP